jgi:lipopolysaccharide transport system ATP-binding protein
MPIIEVKNLGKKYFIGEQQKYLALRDAMNNIVRSPLRWLRGKVQGSHEEFSALQDVSFNVEKGEVLGIIGRNGAGKSTLLKILSQITPPTTGEVRLRGRVGSLLEVGTGFHPELTGRENIFLNGSILGMRKKEIVKKFDEIVEFSGIEKFLDTPVKRYSSGMYVRLAFAVAAHLEPDILIVDEVLAVGDAEFQKKCLGKMQEVTKKDGRTVLFVSHNMGAIRNLCSKVLWLEKGTLKMFGSTEKITSSYLLDCSLNPGSVLRGVDRSGAGMVQLADFFVSNERNEQTVSTFDQLLIHLSFRGSLEKYKTIDCRIAFMDTNDMVLFRIDTGDINVSSLHDNKLTIKTDKINLSPGYCNVNVGIFIDKELSDYVKNIFQFEIVSSPEVRNYGREQLLVIKHSLIF